MDCSRADVDLPPFRPPPPPPHSTTHPSRTPTSPPLNAPHHPPNALTPALNPIPALSDPAPPPSGGESAESFMREIDADHEGDLEGEIVFSDFMMAASKLLLR